MADKRAKRGNGRAVQRHHLEYQEGSFEEKEGEIVYLYKGEHWAVTQMQRRKYISKGFIRAIEFWIEQVKDSAIDLSPQED